MGNQHTLPRLVSANGDELLLVTERPRRFLRIADCMRDIGCKRGHIDNLIKTKKFPTYMLDGLKLIADDDWNEYLATAVRVEVLK